MPTVRFTALVKKIQMASDVQVVLQVLRPDETAPKLVPMRSIRVWVEMETEQPDIEDVEVKEPEQDAQTRLTFDETGFQVPSAADTDEPKEDGQVDRDQEADQVPV